ncbi:MAG: phosphodiester glycosidase family protein [Candidatus Hydrogenedentes bacterium]|nr:phosphodiester glycosidase family protein [Candidatus Hydrogenedentota bacterium]
MAEAERESVTLQEVTHAGHTYSVVRVDTQRTKLRLYWNNPDGQHFGSLDNLKKWLEDRGEIMLFGTNAGMFRPDYAPCGLHIEEGRMLGKLNLRDGFGNFHLKPNGVFYLTEEGARVVVSERFDAETSTVLLATQSGPMLVIDGELHPAFKADSKHRNIRSGVGVVSPTEICFVLSRDEVTFHEFGSLFRDALNCKNALYLDGVISSFCVPGKLEMPGFVPYAGMLAVTTPADKPAP